MLPHTIEDLHRMMPKLLPRLFSRLNLNTPGFDKIKKDVGTRDWISAARKLIDYYKKMDLRDKDLIESDEFIHAIPDSVDGFIDDLYNYQGVEQKQRRLSNGLIDWYYQGERNDNEWAIMVNRQYFVLKMVELYQKTKDEKYTKYWNDTIIDWIMQNKVPHFRDNNGPWRPLDSSLRLHLPWPKAFFGFKDSESFSDAARLLMLDSIHDHFAYGKAWHAFMGNHLVMQCYGLLFGCFCWPEFKITPKIIKFAVKTMQRELFGRQVYPDGVQKEVTSLIQLVAITHFEPFWDLCKIMNIKLPDSFRTRIIEMWNYLTYSIHPNGTTELNNDSNSYGLKELIKEKAIKYNRPDWLYIATNGREGVNPFDYYYYSGFPKSVNFIGSSEQSLIIFGNSGHCILRNGFDADSDYLFFDIGPSGISPTHMHFDKLHISLSLGSEDFLVDNGAYRHVRDRWRREYFKHSRGHNTITVENTSQNKACIANRKDCSHNFHLGENLFAIYGRFTKGYGFNNTRHTRIVLYHQDSYWIVWDLVRTNKHACYSTHWHFHPNIQAEKHTEDTILAKGKDCDLVLRLIQPQQSLREMRLFRGQTDPVPMGWYAPNYNIKEPAWAAEAVFNAQQKIESTFWVLHKRSNGSENESEIIEKIAIENHSQARITLEIKKKKGNHESHIDRWVFLPDRKLFEKDGLNLSEFLRLD